MRRRVVFIRHGATKGNKEGRYVGRTDEGLTPEEYVRLAKEEKISGRVYTSPMKRCVQTAECLCDSRDYTIIPLWREKDFGAYEYKNYQELKDDERYLRWVLSGGSLPFPEGESMEDFDKRCIRGFYQLLAMEEEREKQEEKDIPVVCVLHGGVIMSLLSCFGHEGKNFYDYQCENGGGYVFDCVWSAPEKNAIKFERIEKKH